MKWYEIRIKVKREACDAVSDMLTSMGSGGVAIEDVNDILAGIQNNYKDAKDKESGLYEYYDYIDENLINKKNGMDEESVTVKGYFNENVDVNSLFRKIQDGISNISQFIDTGNVDISYSEMLEEDWANNWKKYYKPFSITENVVIKPSWEEYAAKGSEIVIEMDPGMAFGTGTHETTRMCAFLIQKYIKNRDVVIDVGCGSGILSIIASKLGAEKVLALDIDKQAVKIAMKNCAINNTENRVQVLEGTLSSSLDYKADMIVANIIADVIINLADAVVNNARKGGLFIASGIIKERKDDVVSAYLPKGFKLIEIKEDGEWVAVVFECPGSL